MTTKLATVANLAYQAFHQHSNLTTALSRSITPGVLLTAEHCTKSTDAGSHGGNNSSSLGDSPTHTGYPNRLNNNYRNSNNSSSLGDSPDHLNRLNQGASDRNPSKAANSVCAPQADMLQNLLQSLRSLTPKDVGFDSRWVSDSGKYAAPVVYVHIMENEIFSMGIFVLRPGSRLPLHDHPGMYGTLRVIYGSVRLRSFSHLLGDKPVTLSNPLTQIASNTTNPSINSSTIRSEADPDVAMAKLAGSKWQLSDIIRVQPHQDLVISAESPAHMLTPFEGNFHEIVPVNGPAVFLDILSPPYDHDLGTRECHFYKEIVLPSSSAAAAASASAAASPGLASGLGPQLAENDRSQNHTSTMLAQDNVVYLIETNQPKDYWCESAEYAGPSLV